MAEHGRHRYRYLSLPRKRSERRADGPRGPYARRMPAGRSALCGSTRLVTFRSRAPEWLPKTHFVMLMRDEKLARLQTSFDSENGILTIAEHDKVLLRERLTEPEGCRSVAEFLAEFLGDSVKRPLRVVAAPGHAFADARRKPNATTDKYVSLINRASIRALEAAMEVSVDSLRFRANVYFDGAAPWSEHDWIESEITLGAARLRVISPITRCAATQVNPVTAKRDLDIVSTLERAFGHINMGVYAEVVAGGEIAINDALEISAFIEQSSSA